MNNQAQQDKFIYLPLYLSDYVSQSRKLTMIQRGALIDLSVLYFQENLKLNYSIDQIYRLVFAFENNEKEAINFILENYFQKIDDKPTGFYWVSNSLNEIGSKVLKRLEASRNNGKKGGRGKKKDDKPTGSDLLNLEKSILNESKLNQIKLKEIKENEVTKNNLIDIQFEQFWQNYIPVKTGGKFVKKGNKEKATKAFRKALKKNSFEIIMSALERYLTYCSQNNIFTKNASTWLNEADFEDEEQTVIIAEPKNKNQFSYRNILEEFND